MAASLVTVLIAIATIAGVAMVRRQEDPPQQGRAALLRLIAYWLFTVFVAFELAAGALWAMLRIEYVRVALAHLGYPLYLLIVFALWKLPGALALLVPRFPRLKECAYAGAFFNYTGAAASHSLAGHRASQWADPLIFSAFTLASWALRPASRRLPKLAPARGMRAEAWVVPVLIVAAMLGVAFLSLPKGAPPQ
jgi:hypothetical protein